MQFMEAEINSLQKILLLFHLVIVVLCHGFPAMRNFEMLLPIQVLSVFSLIQMKSPYLLVLHSCYGTVGRPCTLTNSFGTRVSLGTRDRLGKMTNKVS